MKIINSNAQKIFRRKRAKKLKPNNKYPKLVYPNTGIVTTKIPDNFNYDVELDVVICIPSNERYDLVVRVLKQLYEQPTDIKFQIILLNDGSIDTNYLKLMEKFPELIYIQNEKSNGKLYHWYCYNQMWDILRKLNTKLLLQTDDDFILCDDFLNTITKIYRIEHHANYKIGAISPHLWTFDSTRVFENWWEDNTFADGIALIDIGIVKSINYKLQPVVVDVLGHGIPVGVWSQISKAIIKVGRVFYRTNNSLVYHTETLESKLHPGLRVSGYGVIHTKKYIGEL